MRSQIIVFYFYFKQLYFKRLASRKAKKAHKNKVIFLAENESIDPKPRPFWELSFFERRFRHKSPF